MHVVYDGKEGRQSICGVQQSDGSWRGFCQDGLLTGNDIVMI